MMLLVIDVTKGIQTQTAECIIIAELFIDRVIVVLNKVDLVKEDQEEKKDEEEKKKKEKKKKKNQEEKDQEEKEEKEEKEEEEAKEKYEKERDIKVKEKYDQRKKQKRDIKKGDNLDINRNGIQGNKRNKGKVLEGKIAQLRKVFAKTKFGADVLMIPVSTKDNA